MNLSESIRVAVGGLASNRLRSILTMLGIIIGVGAVIALVSFGQGFQRFITATFESLGTNLVYVTPAQPQGYNAQNIRPQPLTVADANAIADPANVPGVSAVAPEVAVAAAVSEGSNTVDMSIPGTTAPWQDIRQWDTSTGRFIEDTDVNNSARVAVLGTSTVKKLFDSGVNPIGQDIRINDIPFRVIGLLQEKTDAAFGDPNLTMVVPITTAQSRLSREGARTADGVFRVSTIYAQTVSQKAMDNAKNAITELLTARHKVQYEGDEDFQVISQDQILSIVDNITGLITAFLGFIAGISLIVGGIGIMNIMLVSLTERTREIGLRKAVGARYLDLMLQFLIESIVLPGL